MRRDCIVAFNAYEVITRPTWISRWPRPCKQSGTLDATRTQRAIENGLIDPPRFRF